MTAPGLRAPTHFVSLRGSIPIVRLFLPRSDRIARGRPRPWTPGGHWLPGHQGRPVARGARGRVGPLAGPGPGGLPWPPCAWRPEQPRDAVTSSHPGRPRRAGCQHRRRCPEVTPAAGRSRGPGFLLVRSPVSSAWAPRPRAAPRSAPGAPASPPHAARFLDSTGGSRRGWGRGAGWAEPARGVPSSRTTRSAGQSRASLSRCRTRDTSKRLLAGSTRGRRRGVEGVKGGF